jgi:hypothetical protein
MREGEMFAIVAVIFIAVLSFVIGFVVGVRLSHSEVPSWNIHKIDDGYVAIDEKGKLPTMHLYEKVNEKAEGNAEELQEKR